MDLIEKVGRAICAASTEHLGYTNKPCPQVCDECRNQARAAIEVVRDEIIKRAGGE